MPFKAEVSGVDGRSAGTGKTLRKRSSDGPNHGSLWFSDVRVWSKARRVSGVCEEEKAGTRDSRRTCACIFLISAGLYLWLTMAILQVVCKPALVDCSIAKRVPP